MQQYIQKFQLANVLPDVLLHAMTLEAFEKGERIITQGEIPHAIYFLVEGRSKVYTTSKDGRSLILTFTTPFTVISDIEFIERRPYLNTVEAVTDGYYLKLPLTLVEQYGMQHLPFMTFMLKTLTRKFYDNANALHFNFLHSVDVRFASYLLAMTHEEPNVPIHDLKDVAQMIGTSYRHLNRIIGQLSDAGYIERAQRTIRILNREQLLHLAKYNIYEER